MKTFKDFLVECENYPNSMEAYDLMKECAELTVTAQFLENQRFLQENADLVGGKCEDGTEVSFTEGYFVEAAEAATIESIEQSFCEKANNIGTKIKNGVLKIINVFRNFFTKIINKFDADTKVIVDVRKRFIENIDKIKVDDLNKTLKEIAEKNGFTPTANQPFAKKIKLSDDTKKSLSMDLIAAALSDTYIYAKTNVSVEKNNAGVNSLRNAPVSASRLVKIIGTIDGKKLDIETSVKELEAAMSEGWRNGIEINVNGGKLKSIIDKLTAIEERIKKEAENKQVEDIYANMADNPGTAGKHASAMNELYSMLNGAVGATCKLYNSVVLYRKNAANAINTAIANGGVSSKAKGEE